MQKSQSLTRDKVITIHNLLITQFETMNYHLADNTGSVTSFEYWNAYSALMAFERKYKLPARSKELFHKELLTEARAREKAAENSQ